MKNSVWREVRFSLYLAAVLNGLIIQVVPFQYKCNFTDEKCFACGLRTAVDLFLHGRFRLLPGLCSKHGILFHHINPCSNRSFPLFFSCYTGHSYNVSRMLQTKTCFPFLHIPFIFLSLQSKKLSINDKTIYEQLF